MHSRVHESEKEGGHRRSRAHSRDVSQGVASTVGWCV